MEDSALSLPSELGRITIAPEAIAQIVGRTAAECYGVVGMSLRAPGPARDRVTRLLPKGKALRGIVVRNLDGAVALELYVVVAYGLNLAEVAGTVRSRVGRPSSSTRTRWRFGSKRRFVATIEWLRL